MKRFDRRPVLALAIVGAFMLPPAIAPAAAQDAYTAEDIVSHFAGSLNTGTTRALCIGSASECGEVAEAAAAAEPSPFDLRIQFELNSAELTPLARTQLDTLAAALNDRRLSRASFNIDGHTDALGDDTTNQRLSERRAASVVSYLVAKGIKPDKLVARGYGETKPLTEDHYDERNRRVEATLNAVQ